MKRHKIFLDFYQNFLYVVVRKLEEMEKILKHPRNKNIDFDKKSHTYRVNDEIYKGVSSLLSKFTAPFEKMKIAGYIAKRDGVSVDEVLAKWDKAREYGDYVHEIVENYVNNNLEIQTEELSNFKEFIDENEFEPVISEWVVYDEDIQRASAIDLILKNKNDEIIIADIKTMKKPIEFNGYRNRTMSDPLDHLQDSRYYKQALQVNIYKYWLENKYGLTVSPKNFILRLRNNVCEKIPVINLEHEVKQIYKWIK